MQRIDPMRDFRDAKAMAQTLREALKTKSVSLTHSESRELVARMLGLHNWNVLSATIQFEVQPTAARSASFTTDCRRAKSRAHWQTLSPLSSRATSDRSKTFWRPVMWSRGCKRFSL
jgi:hypothetical protein